MLISPGKSVRHYLEEDRKPFVRPIVFVIVTSLIYAFVAFFFSRLSNISTSPYTILFVTPFFTTGTMTSNAVLHWIAEASAYTTLLLGLLVAFAAKLFFRKSGYNFFEIFVLLCYICGIAMLFLSVSAIISYLFDFNITISRFGQRFSVIYLVWAVGQFFNENQRGVVKTAMSYIKAFLSYYISAALYITFVLCIPFFLGYDTISDLISDILPIIISFVTFANW